MGVKKFTDQFVNPGEVIVRQRGGGFRGGQGVSFSFGFYPVRGDERGVLRSASE